MPKVVAYQGYTIESAPHRLEGEKWRLHIFISLEDRRGVLTRQFTVDNIYATEQEANIHGIAYGQRLIDGKVDGQSVVGMKARDRRTTPRLPVQFRTVFSAYSILEGTGLLSDLSMGGCCIESPVTVEAGVSLQLLTYAPDVPLLIEAATVQWVRPQTFGVGFFRISEYTRLQLAQVISS